MHSPLLPLALSIPYASRSHLDHRWRRDTCRDSHSRLYLIERGDARIMHHGRTWQLQPDWMYIIPLDTRLSYHCETHLDIDWVHFTATLPTGLDLFHGLACDHAIPLADPAAARRQMAQLRAVHPAHLAGDPAASFTAHGLLLQLLAPVLATVDLTQQAQRSTQLRRLEPALAHLEAHLHHPLRIDTLARLVHLEKTYFCKLFRDALGLPPIRYHLHLRIRRAAQLLRQDPDRTLADLAAELGFTDAFHLSRSFTKVIGESPSAHRRRLLHPAP